MACVLTALLSFAAGIYAVSVLNARVWDRALVIFACEAEGRTGVYDPDNRGVCADLTDAYPADEAFERVLPLLQAGLERNR